MSFTVVLKEVFGSEGLDVINRGNLNVHTCRFPCPPSQGAVAMPAALSIKENHSGRRTAWQLDAVPLPSVGMLPLCIFLDCA
jgi:hypothetical protein